MTFKALVLVLTTVVFLAACASDNSIKNLRMVTTSGEESLGRIMVLNASPEEIAEILEDDNGIDMAEALPIMAAAEVDIIDTVYEEKAVVIVLKGPLKIGANVRIAHNMELMYKDGNRKWTYNYIVRDDTVTTPLVIVNGFRIKLPAWIQFRAYVNDKLVVFREITAQ